ncbi:MAG: glycoside hydrolase family 3 N-terminal domain-containing protein [Candidatus Methylacidiphilales bacterium]|nr:glycoside hydrolase family 3 N-terminal domain-containing protein [Candidatus Methylacidiphilales bacterium]
MLQPDARIWVEKTLRELSDREKINQLFQTTLTHWDQRIPQQTLVDRVRFNQAGGAFMAGRPWKQLRDLARQATEGQKVPVIFSGDSECGPNTPAEGVAFGSAMALGAIADLQEACTLAYEVGRVAALQCRACGVRWSFAPVADLNFNPDNPITNIRSFGSDPERVGALVSAYLRGMQDHGLAATLKHFPGDGMDSRDQHITTAVNPLTEEAWQSTYGKVFRAGLEAGPWSVMVGHLAWSARSGRNPNTGLFLPATADSRIQIDLLRNEMGFTGVIVSDAIGMGGLAGHFKSEADLALANVLTGSDVVLFVENLPAAADTFLKAMDRGELTRERLDASVRRILELKAKVGLTPPAPVLPDESASAAAFANRHEHTVRQVAEKSVTLIQDRNRLFPIKLPRGSKILVFDLPRDVSDLGKLAVVDAASNTDPGVQPTLGSNPVHSRPKAALAEELEKGGYVVQWVENLSDYERAVSCCDAVLYVFRNGPMAGRNSGRISYNAIQSLDLVRIFSHFPCYFLSLGSPYVAWEIPVLPNLICTYAGHDAAQRAAASALLGRIPFAGILPVHLPEDSGFSQVCGPLSGL